MATGKKATPPRTDVRDARSGRFVDHGEAKRRPDTTVVEKHTPAKQAPSAYRGPKKTTSSGGPKIGKD